MVEKKTKTTTKTTAKKAVAKKTEVEVAINAENIGFKAGDVYQALASAKKSLTVKEIASVAKISVEETLLGVGWLFKEGKIMGDGKKVLLA